MNTPVHRAVFLDAECIHMDCSKKSFVYQSIFIGIRVRSNIDMVIFHINKCTRIPVDLHRYKMYSFVNTVLSRIDKRSRISTVLWSIKERLYSVPVISLLCDLGQTVFVCRSLATVL